MLCELKQIPGKLYTNNLMTLELENSMALIVPGLPVSIIGLPKYIEARDMSNVAPSEPTSEFNSIKTCICGGGKVVKSDGIVMNIGESLAVSCCTANGMSGSPLLVQSHGKFKVIGILHGGPVSDLHYLWVKIASDSSNIDKLLQELIKSFSQNASQITNAHIRTDIENMLWNVNRFKISMKDFQQIIMNYIYSRAQAIEASFGKQVNHNIVWPLTSFYPRLMNFFKLLLSSVLE